MLQKINHIKNIGRFYNVSISGTADADPRFKKFNLIYADNGTGKSTLSTIFKSLWKNAPERLIERKTIGISEESNANIQIDDEIYTFHKNKWNKTPEIPFEIFDEEFISKNVFSPDGVELKNRRGLFNYIVLGEENVKKVEEVTRLNNLINGDLKTEIETAENTLIKKANISEIKILDTEPKIDDDKLDSLINEVKSSDKIIANAERITKEKILDKIPDFEIISYTETISVDLSNLSFSAEYKTHIHTHNKWIKDGMEIVQNGDQETCPFCRQGIKENNAIATYKTIFSEEYENLRNKVKEQCLSIERIYSDAVINSIIELIERNNERCDFWHNLNNDIPETISLDVCIKETTKAFKKALVGILEKKDNNLLEKIYPEEDETVQLKKENEFRAAITKYNEIIDNLNKLIQSVKDSLQNVEELKIQNEKNRIKVICNDVGYRDVKTSKIYEKLKENRTKRENATTQINTLRKEIDDSSSKILEKYEHSINRELENFGVEFSIKGVKRKSDRSRTETVQFDISLKGEIFNPNGSDDNPYKLSNTLSSGDKSTLAFAFFIAKYQREDISNQILVFDDPITSLDFFRKTQTKNTILRFSEKAKQVIILTHSMEFTKLFKHVKNGRFFHVNKNNSSSGLSFTPYNKLSDMAVDKHDYNYEQIQKYIVEPNSVNRIDVMRSVRPYVETTIRHYRPDFGSLSLGKIIAELRKEGSVCEDYINDLIYIDDTIVPESSHGSSDIEADHYENITDTELMTICEKTIRISAPPILEVN